MSEEKRKFKRLKVKEGGLAAFTKPDEIVNLGYILDISMGGLCMQYSPTNWSNEGSQIHIFGCNDRCIHVDRVEYRIAYDQEIPEDPWEQISTRRCGLEFKKLSVKNLSILQEFIERFSIAEA
jgi:hypothetical protein